MCLNNKCIFHAFINFTRKKKRERKKQTGSNFKEPNYRQILHLSLGTTWYPLSFPFPLPRQLETRQLMAITFINWMPVAFSISPFPCSLSLFSAFSQFQTDVSNRKAAADWRGKGMGGGSFWRVQPHWIWLSAGQECATRAKLLKFNPSRVASTRRPCTMAKWGRGIKQGEAGAWFWIWSESWKRHSDGG